MVFFDAIGILFTGQDQYFSQFVDHVVLSGIAIALSIVIGVAAGSVLTRFESIAFAMISIANLGRTIPSLAVLAIVYPIVGTGKLPAVIALVALGVPPILLSTYTAVREVDADVVDAATGMGMTSSDVLLKVELPMSMPLIISGVRTSSVQVVAAATLAAFIGGGGLGDLILAGLLNMQIELLLVGAMLVAIIAVVVEVTGTVIEKHVLPQGIRIASGTDDEHASGYEAGKAFTSREWGIVAAGAAGLAAVVMIAGSAFTDFLTTPSVSASEYQRTISSVTIGSRKSPESRLAAELYGAALASQGYTVAHRNGIATDAEAIELLRQGTVDIFPGAPAAVDAVRGAAASASQDAADESAGGASPAGASRAVGAAGVEDEPSDEPTDDPDLVVLAVGPPVQVVGGGGNAAALPQAQAPILRRQLVDDAGPTMSATLGSLSASLTPEAFNALLAQVAAGSDPIAVAAAHVETLGMGAPAAAEKPVISMGSKDFTESLLLGEMYAQALEARGYPVRRRLNLGSTGVVDAALRRNDIDIYPEYTGTSMLAVFKASIEPGTTRDAIAAETKERYGERGSAMLTPSPFSNGYAIVVTEEFAKKHKLETLSDMAKVAGEMTMASIPGFEGREDGTPLMEERYGIKFGNIKTYEPSLKYKAIVDGAVDAAIGFETDGQIARFKLKVLTDDKAIWPPYQVAPILSPDLSERLDGDLQATLDNVTRSLDTPTMQALNDQVDGEGREVEDVAREFLIKRHIVR